jgi:uncharacterized UBP type Zn finger protein
MSDVERIMSTSPRTTSTTTTTAAPPSSSSTDIKSNLAVLVEMGFEKRQAKTALAMSGGDLDGAVASLLGGSESPEEPPPRPASSLSVQKSTGYTISKDPRAGMAQPASSSGNSQQTTGSDMLKKLRESATNRIDPNDVDEPGVPLRFVVVLLLFV